MSRYDDVRAKVRWNLLLNPGKGEVEACQLLKDAGYTIHRQLYINGCYADIAIPSIGLVIEIDHPCKKINRQQKRREVKIKAEKWQILRVKTNQVKDVVAMVKRYMAPVCLE